MSTIEIKSVSKRFDGVHALVSVDLEIEKGIITGLVGPNGSGKSTLLNCFSGTIKPTSGSIVYEGITTSENPVTAYYAGMSRTFQSARLFPQLSVMENLLLVEDSKPLFLSFHKKKSEREQMSKIRSVLKLLGIQAKETDLAEDLSYGQKKLVELARVLLSEKEILLLDEPFAGLFPKVINSLIEILITLKKSGKTIILVEHNMRIIKRLCDRVIVLDAGSVIADGTADEVFDAKQVREAYLGE